MLDALKKRLDTLRSLPQRALPKAAEAVRTAVLASLGGGARKHKPSGVPLEIKATGDGVTISASAAFVDIAQKKGQVADWAEAFAQAVAEEALK